MKHADAGEISHEEVVKVIELVVAEGTAPDDMGDGNGGFMAERETDMDFAEEVKAGEAVIQVDVADGSRDDVRRDPELQRRGGQRVSRPEVEVRLCEALEQLVGEIVMEEVGATVIATKIDGTELLRVGVKAALRLVAVSFRENQGVWRRRWQGLAGPDLTEES